MVALKVVHSKVENDSNLDGKNNPQKEQMAVGKDLECENL